ncbi:MAG: DUF1365 domain-containing protein [Candidatus Doudnabacteria bacterium]
MRSRLYTGWLAHERTRPARNEFRYPIYYLALDLDELEQVDSALRLFSHNRANLVSFWDRDHGPHDGSPLRPWIDSLVQSVGIDLTGGRVLLLTFPRILGARFYPVSFWYCFSADGTPMAVMAEVHNTYRDRHNYLLHNGGRPFDWKSTPTATKAFFVSPFVQRENVTYEFSFSEPADDLAVSIRGIVEGSHMLTAAFNVHAEELTDATLLRTVLVHGPISIVGLIRIHWQALRLFSKGVPLFPHTPPPAEETSK